MENSNKIAPVAIVILFVVVAIGYVALRPGPSKNPTDSLPPPAPPVIPVQGDDTGGGPLRFPSADASPEERERFRVFIEETAERVSAITISSCTPNTPVVKVLPNEKITLRNLDPLPHTLSHADATFSLAANESKMLEGKAFFKEGLGAYGYRCDDGEPVGVFYVVEKL